MYLLGDLHNGSKCATVSFRDGAMRQAESLMQEVRVANKASWYLISR